MRQRSVGNRNVDNTAREKGHLCIHTDNGMTHKCECRRTIDHMQLSMLAHPVPTEADLVAERAARQPTLF